MVSKTAVRQSVPKGALPDFTAVPRKSPRHDGWTPERQRAFIAALADTGCVAVAARMVNMSQAGVYTLRRQPGAEGFRAAMDAAQSLGLQAVKDEAFDRAMNGELIPVFVAGKLMGFRRKKNDRLLMFILRHYGTDAAGRRTTINYFSTRATAGAAAAAPSGSGPTRSGAHASARDAMSVRPTTGEAVSIDVTNSVREGGSALSAAEASTTTVKTVISGPGNAPSQIAADDAAAAMLNAFEGVPLDAEAQAEIYRSLEACAERRRALEADPEHDPQRVYIGERETNGYLGQLEIGVEGDWEDRHPEGWRRPEGEHRWESLGAGGEAAEIDRVVGEMKERLAKETPEERAARETEAAAAIQTQIAAQSILPKPEPDPDDPRLDWRNWETGSYAEPKAPACSAAALGRRDEPGRLACAEGDRTNERRVQDAPHPADHAGGLIDPQLNSVRDVPLLLDRSPDRDPGPSQQKRRYKKRKPKPRFEPVSAEAGEAEYEARKAEAMEQVEVERREAAAGEARRRDRRASC